MTNSVFAERRAERFTTQPLRNADQNRTVVAASRPRKRATQEFARHRTSPWAKVVPLAFSVALGLAVWIGWLDRDDSGLTPESGVGYWLGIAGSSLMLLLLLYPLRKRVRSLRAIGTVAFWFRVHMVLGAVGCVLILWHANFKLGSINSNAALAAMLVVAASGIVGRYLYSKIHRGLYGRKAVVEEILADAETLRRVVRAELPVSDRVAAEMHAFAQLGARPPDGIFVGLVWLPVIGWRGHVMRTRLIAEARHVIAIQGKRRGWSRQVRRQKLASAAELATLHVAAVTQAAAFALYERLFRVWHVFHMPLFFLLVIAAIVHVFAAHFF